MKAKLLPLEGKYYATQIKITRGDHDSVMEIHIGDYGEPSVRELKSMGCSREEYRQATDPCYELGYDGSHYESQFTYETANEIVKAINSYKNE